MSGFIGRVAARAVGQAAAARPRLPDVFGERGLADAGLEVVGVEPAAPGAAPPADGMPATARRPARPPAPARGARVPTAAVDVSPPRRLEAAAASTPIPQRAGEPAPAAADAKPRTPGETRRTAASSGPGRLFETASPAAEAEDGAPISPARPARVAASVPPPAASAREERPAVRVHIGRLEVRANLEAPAPQRPRREGARPPELSLSDYLRGRAAP